MHEPSTNAPRRLVALALAVASLLAVVACSESSAGPSPTIPASPMPGPVAPPDPTGHPDQVLALPGLNTAIGTQYAGYASVRGQACADILCDGAGEDGLFYWYVGEATGATDAPTILWTNGGPGSTSFWGFFTENGPYQVNEGGALEPRPDSWTNTANYLIFDHPLGVGLSFATDGALPANVQEGVDQWYAALIHFLDAHPEVAANPIVLAGESYGGTYVPLLAKAILDGNERAGRDVVKLTGTVLAAPWVDPLVQQSMDTTYAFAHGIITAADKARLDEVYEQCRVAILAQKPSSKEAKDICGQLKKSIGEISGRYLFNLASTGDPSTDPITAYLNQPAVRAAIHAKPGGTFDFYSEAVGDNYVVGSQDSYLWAVQEVLDRDVPVMVVSGLNDAADVNFLGVGKWLDLMTGPKADAFHAAPTTQWKGTDPNEVLGYIQQGGGLSWVKVLNAGHLVPGDQPQLIDLIDQMLLASNP